MTAPHTAGLLAAVLLLAFLGRRLARCARQPAVIGEIVIGLSVGPVVVLLFGRPTFDVLLPDPVHHMLAAVAKVALILYVVAVTHELGHGDVSWGGRSTLLVGIGSLLPTAVLGGLLGAWLSRDGSVDPRDPYRAWALIVFTAAALSVTAVPVLARILADRGMERSQAGRISFAVSLLIDTVSWLLLSLAVALGAGTPSSVLPRMAVLGGALLLTVAARRALASPAARRMPGRSPWAPAVLLAIAALLAGVGAERVGLTAVLGAALVGLAVPHGQEIWSTGVRWVGRVGRALLPTFFVVTGMTVFAQGARFPRWELLLVVLLAATGGKLLGAYLGARSAGEEHWTGLRIGILMNTRGLTELVVLQVGFAAGLITAEVLLVFVIMAVTTTMATGPLLTLVDAGARRSGPGVRGR